MIRRLLLPVFILTLSGCARLTLSVVNTTGSELKNLEIRSPVNVVTVPSLAPGAEHRQELKPEKGGWVNLSYLDAQGRQSMASSPIELKAGECGGLRLSITAKGTLEAARTK